MFDIADGKLQSVVARNGTTNKIVLSVDHQLALAAVKHVRHWARRQCPFLDYSPSNTTIDYFVAPFGNGPSGIMRQLMHN